MLSKQTKEKYIALKKLSDNDIKDIRKYYRLGYTIKQLHSTYSEIHLSHIYRILNGIRRIDVI